MSAMDKASAALQSAADLPPPEAMPARFGALPYHVAVAGHLRTGEAALWSWFESDQFSKRYSEMVKLELLKSTYRLTRADQPGLYAQADVALNALGLDLPVTVYQRQGGGDGANAALIFLPDEAAIMLMGNIAELLSEGETLALLGHELAHHRLYTLDGGQYFTAARLLDWCAEQPGCDAAFRETDRLYQLHTEIFADMGALHVTSDRDAVIASLIKVSTGLRSVTARSYLEQTSEILEGDKAGSEGVTHPELYIRAKALDLLAADPPRIGETEALVRGKIEAGRLDILGQHKLSTLSRELVDCLMVHPFMRGEYAANLAERYFPGYRPAAVPSADHAAMAVEIAGLAKSCHDYLAFLLLDFATVDPDHGEAGLAWTLDLADRIGLFTVYEALARKELKRKKEDLTKLRRGAAEKIEKANHAA
ncbi:MULTISPECIES: hypothetical protein [Rhodomicrobium]|uniref:hypothetical protein n=1 Tax=Rhodomicrobium TaxID=1068 RepID=UPI000F74AF4A|nr:MULTISPECIES: hypothetical protein [Rhodomicrobium]